jgi:hypothetical protein
VQKIGKDGSSVIYWKFSPEQVLLRKQVGPFLGDQTLVGSIARAFGAWCSTVTGQESGVDTLDLHAVESALLYFDKNLTIDHLNNHTDFLYPYKHYVLTKDHVTQCKLKKSKIIRIQREEEYEDMDELEDRGILE